MCVETGVYPHLTANESAVWLFFFTSETFYRELSFPLARICTARKFGCCFQTVDSPVRQNIQDLKEVL
ncbi:uncharacterized protein LOC144647809 isoform X4 [Oculina patagonica]